MRGSQGGPLFVVKCAHARGDQPSIAMKSKFKSICWAFCA